MHGAMPEEARERAYATPLADLHPGDPELFRSFAYHPVFERLRAEDPVHRCRESEFGPYWSVTLFNDIMAVDTNHQVFSSEADRGGISIRSARPQHHRRPSFIAMDPPKHDEQRKAVSPVVAPANLALLEPIIRERVRRIFDALPLGETFDWVDKVSIELTTQMLATLFDFPFEERRKLTYWSDVATASPRPGEIIETRRPAPRRADEVPRILHAAVERAGERAAARRPDLDDGAQRRHAEHDADGIPRQHRAADRSAATTPPATPSRAACWRSTRTRRSTTSCAPIRR